MLPLPLLFFALDALSTVLATPVALDVRRPAGTRAGIHLPLYRRMNINPVRKRAAAVAGTIGLGDVLDVTYNVLIQVGEVLVPLVLDSGSSDLWVLSTACATDCFATSVPLYPPTSFQPTGIAVQLQYGDSLTGTRASGPIGKDTAGIAGFSLDSQYFAAISSTNTSVLETGSAGIFGLGFPINSVIWNQLLSAKYPRARSIRSLSSRYLANRIFPDLSFISRHNSNSPRQLSSPDTSPSVSDVLATFGTNGPMISRLISAGALSRPLVTITLQRDTFDIGGNMGVLSIGELPPGVEESNLTWVPLRGYTVEQGGLPAPADSPDEVYPLTWEVMLDDVYFDGEKLPQSDLSPNITLSALIDTGNSLVRGPKDVIQAIVDRLGGTTYPCSDAHSLEFEIGGTRFPVDPRDFGSQAFTNSDGLCIPSLASTDPPGNGFLYSWSIGDPFLKSVMASYYYGNLTYPSHDPPRIGLLSTVPSDAVERLKSVVNYANSSLGGNLPAISEAPPTSTLAPASTNPGGVPQATESGLAPSAQQPSSTAHSRSVSSFSLAFSLVFTYLIIMATHA
ncbi:acid protease [Auriscalpium vulgare]|uniref:Acid protease n=1 Tax=Auriscalpium vulgare TaxID=40419 RepID=A0ACB8S5W8_9AGAM|nr:acid protease [Auriscalpium vulgare]